MKDGNAAPLRYPIAHPPEAGEAVEVADGIFWMRLPLPMALDHVNVFVLDDGDGWTVIDTGFDDAKTRLIWKRLLAGPFFGKPVNRVIVTHYHPDHVGLAGWFQLEHGAQLVTTRTSWLMARMLTLDEQTVPTPQTLEFWRSAGMDSTIFEKRRHERPFNFSDMVHPLPQGFKRIQEGDSIGIGGRNWTVRIGNGHAPEHATFWCEDEALVLGGDQLLPSISPNLGVYASEPDADPVSDWLASCESLRSFSNDEQLVLPGHKLPFTGLPVRMHQLIENHHGALERLLGHLDTPRTAAECFAPLFKRQIGEGVYGLALVESVAHLNHLHMLGRARRDRRQDGAWLWNRTD